VRMQERTEDALVVASPQPRVEVTLNQRIAAEVAESWPRPTAVPDSGMKPETMGSDVHA
jgi:hypothetical protein